jgi:hypothetical protein
MLEIHQPPNVKVIDKIWVGISEDEDGKNGRRRLTVEREAQEVLAMSDVRTSPFGVYDLIDWLSRDESH